MDRLILVDTRQKSRIGRFAALADSGNVEIHVYDHHPDSDDDVKGKVEIVPRGWSHVTLLIQELRNRGIELNAEEATVLALGIYEDTGSFTFSSTTEDDLEAAGWLLAKGANLNIISNMMTSELSQGSDRTAIPAHRRVGSGQSRRDRGRCDDRRRRGVCWRSRYSRAQI